VQNLVLRKTVFSELAHKKPHFDRVTAEQVRESAEDAHNFFRSDFVVEVKKVESLFHTRFEVD
jgi:hypothetical protein